MGDWSYRSNIFTSALMDVSGQLHFSPSLPLEIQPPARIEQEDMWAPEPVWTFLKEKNYSSTENGTPAFQSLTCCHTNWDIRRQPSGSWEHNMAYLLIQELWRQRNSRCYVMARTHAAEERLTYAVTLRNSRRGVASGVLYGSAPRSLLRSCTVSTSLQQWINTQQ
jgi:hypothetical protein